MTFLIMYRTVTVLDAHETHAPTSRSVRCPVPNQHFIPLAAGVCESRDASLWRTALRVEAHELDVAAIGLYVGADLVLEDLLDGTHRPVVLALRRRLPRLLLLHAMTRHFGTATEGVGGALWATSARRVTASLLNTAAPEPRKPSMQDSTASASEPPLAPCPAEPSQHTLSRSTETVTKCWASVTPFTPGSSNSSAAASPRRGQLRTEGCSSITVAAGVARARWRWLTELGLLRVTCVPVIERRSCGGGRRSEAAS